MQSTVTANNAQIKSTFLTNIKKHITETKLKNRKHIVKK